MEPEKPVFFDSSRRRWPVIRRVLIVGGSIFLFFAVLFISSLFFSPELPELKLTQNATVKATTTRARTNHLDKQADELAAVQSVKLLPPATFPSPVNAKRIAYYVSGDNASRSSFETHMDSIDTLVPDWLRVNPDNGKIIECNVDEIKDLYDLSKPRRDKGMRIVPLVSNQEIQNWNAASCRAMLKDTARMDRMVSELMAFSQRFPIAGFSVDFLEVPPDALSDFERVLKDLAQKLHAANMTLSVNVPLDEDITRIAELAAISDEIILLAFDQHYEKSESGPVAGQNWFSTGVAKCAKVVPLEKLVIAMSTSGYDWVKGTKNGESKTFSEALMIARDKKASVEFDAKELCPRYDYVDAKGLKHVVWYSSATTVFNQIATSLPIKPHGYALFTLGSEDPTVWSVFGRPTLDRGMLAGLRGIPGKDMFDFIGKGEVMKMVGTPAPGSRDFTYDDARGLIVNESIAEFPAPWQFKKFGTDQKVVALTFDDGPDPKYTPLVLDVLKQKNAHATFFVCGTRVQDHPELVRRAFAEGHEIGNHTYSHPNLMLISDAQIQVEANGVQRLLETTIGHRTVLFRPPYNDDSDPSSDGEARPLKTIDSLGYLICSFKVESNDWKRRGTDSIVNSVCEGIEKGNGQVVLLHDAGGDREQTLAALPILIDRLRAKGYEFAPMSRVIGKSTDEVMPAASQEFMAVLNRQSFALIEVMKLLLGWIFMFGIFASIVQVLGFGVLAIIDRMLKPRTDSLAPYTKKVAVLVPAYNEEKVVTQTVDSLLKSDYSGPLEIIVVDDGSSDSTFARVQEAFKNEPRVRAFKKSNGGKSAALNFAIERSDAEVFVALDADTVFKPDCITKMVRHFSDPKIAAVAGNAKVGNRLNILTKWQALEYVTSHNLDRRAFNRLNCITVVPGAVGAWRTSVVTELGGFKTDTLAEDCDLTLDILQAGHRISYEEDAIAFTEAPDTVKGFLKQRYRWMFGTAQAVWKHKQCLFNPRHGALGWIAMPNLILMKIIFPIFIPLVDFVMLSGLASVVIHAWQHPSDSANMAVVQTLLLYTMFCGVDFAACILAFALEPKEDKWLMLWLFPQRFFYRQLMYIVSAWTFLSMMRGGMVGWGKLERKATVRILDQRDISIEAGN